MQQNLQYKTKIEQIRAKKQLEQTKLKQANKGVAGGIDLDQIADIVEGLQGEGGGVGGILNNPIVKGLLKGAVGGSEQKQLPAEFQNVEFED